MIYRYTLPEINSKSTINSKFAPENERKWNIIVSSKRGILKAYFQGPAYLLPFVPMGCLAAHPFFQLPRLGLRRDQIHSIVFPLYRTSANRQPFKKCWDLSELKKFETVEFVEVDVI